MRVVASLIILSFLRTCGASYPVPRAAIVLTNGNDGTQLLELFKVQVNRRLDLPEEDQRHYEQMLQQALSDAGLRDLKPQYVVLVDRNPLTQAVMIFWKSLGDRFVFIGASPASTGRPGQFEHFETPTGVFDHTVDNPDFRAEGTRNEFGILGYGRKGMRIYDFGWLNAPKGWGNRAESVMRLQMHSTDPDLLETRLGSIQSKGCIRVPASFNTFIDHYGVLDADYERAIAAGKSFFVLNPERQPTRWSGRYLIIVDSQRRERPSWSPSPVARTR
jgi:hypothetical protein